MRRPTSRCPPDFKEPSGATRFSRTKSRSLRESLKISALDKPPEFEAGDVYGITTGKFNHEDGLWKTTIGVKGGLCVYDSSHPSGHFKKIVWKKGVGLIEYASGYGAHADGYRLKRQK
jgi:hypothetical protein